MTQEELQKLRDLPLIAGGGLLQRLGITLSHGRFLCPAHADHTPSASISKSKNLWKCWSCGAGGNAIDLTMLVLNKNFKSACEWLLGDSITSYKPATIIEKKEVTFDASRYERFFIRPWLSEKARQFLFDERLLDPRVLSWCRITSWRDRNGVNWLQIPYYDMEGKLIGVQNRNLDYHKDNKGSEGPGRFKFPYGSQTSIYNLQIVKSLKQGDECWIAEGCSDCWSLMSNHHKAIAIASATLLQPKDKQLLRDITTKLSLRWKMMIDNDEPGRKLGNQLNVVLPMLEIIEPPQGVKDYSDYFVSLRKSGS